MIFSAAVGTLCGIHWHDGWVSGSVSVALVSILGYIDKYVYMLLSMKATKTIKEIEDASHQPS